MPLFTFVFCGCLAVLMARAVLAWAVAWIFRVDDSRLQKVDWLFPVRGRWLRYLVSISLYGACICLAMLLWFLMLLLLDWINTMIGRI